MGEQEGVLDGLFGREYWGILGRRDGEMDGGTLKCGGREEGEGDLL